MLIFIVLFVMRKDDDSHETPYFNITTIEVEDGTAAEEIIISGPPEPPPGYERPTAPLSPEPGSE